MISSRMLFGQITSSPRAPAELSSLHSSNCSLLVLSFRSSPFRISNLEPLFVKHPGGGTPNLRARRYLPGAEGLCHGWLRLPECFGSESYDFPLRRLPTTMPLSWPRSFAVRIGCVPPTFGLRD